MKYGYHNRSNVKDYHKKIREGFKRFHSMNAQTSTFGLTDNGETRFLVMQFVSYETDIIQVIYDYKYNEYRVYCNGNPFNWSCSTSRQLSRWLYESPMVPFDAGQLKSAYNNCHSITPDLSIYRYYNIEYNFFNDSYAFERNWR